MKNIKTQLAEQSGEALLLPDIQLGETFPYKYEGIKRIFAAISLRVKVGNRCPSEGEWIRCIIFI